MSYAIPCPNCGDGLWCNICGAPYEGEADPRVSVLEGERDRARAEAVAEVAKLLRAEAGDLRDDYWDGVRFAADFIESPFARSALESLPGEQP